MSSSGSDEEGGDAYDLLASIKKQLNQEHEDDDKSDDEEDEVKESISQNKENEIESEKDRKSNEGADEDEEHGINLNKILVQNGIEIANKADESKDDENISSDNNSRNYNEQSNNTSEQHVASEQQDSHQGSQQQENKSSVERNTQSLIQIQQSQEKEIVQEVLQIKKSQSNNNISSQISEQRSPEKEKNVFTVVRSEAVQREEEKDHLLASLESISIKKNLLEDPDIIGHKLDSQFLEQTIEQVRKRFQENLQKFSSKQLLDFYLTKKGIFDRIRDINKKSAFVLDKVITSNKTFAKKKIVDKEKYVKDLQRLQNDSQKTKTFLLMMIQRLECVEHDIDKLTDIKLKQQQKAQASSQSPQNQANEQQANKNASTSPLQKVEEK